MSTSPMQMSEARRFQQLKGHPFYLKLNDAAEALNRVLDQARTERMSMTAALERLLEIEVEATEARRLAARERFACLPEPWSLADFDFAAQPGLDEKWSGPQPARPSATSWSPRRPATARTATSRSPSSPCWPPPRPPGPSSTRRATRPRCDGFPDPST
ncbi:ATP-binding protein [Kitasatospora sp. NPDC057198]|uniref:ATP-binding protein n=1 Tax=Kitasatospora sp. NPDC057198 TaxID=3346046 RepID=UPI003636E6DD